MNNFPGPFVSRGPALSQDPVSVLCCSVHLCLVKSRNTYSSVNCLFYLCKCRWGCKSLTRVRQTGNHSLKFFTTDQKYISCKMVSCVRQLANTKFSVSEFPLSLGRANKVQMSHFVLIDCQNESPKDPHRRIRNKRKEDFRRHFRLNRSVHVQDARAPFLWCTETLQWCHYTSCRHGKVTSMQLLFYFIFFY